MKLLRTASAVWLVLASLDVGRAAASGVTAVATGSVSGRIDLRTYRPRGAERIPAGSTVEVSLSVPDGNHSLTVGGTFLRADDADTLPYKISGLPLGETMTMSVSAYTSEPTDSPWTLSFRRSGLGAPTIVVALDVAEPDLKNVDFDLRGVPDVPASFPQAPVSSGSVAGVVRLSGVDGGDPVVAAGDVELAAMNASTGEALPLAAPAYVIRHVAETTDCQCPTLEFRFDKIPLDTPLWVWVQLSNGAKAANGARVAFHVKSNEKVNATDYFGLTLTAQQPTPSTLTFYPYAVGSGYVPERPPTLQAHVSPPGR